MDTSLVTVTLLSMTMAAALSLVVWRLLREERRRSEARVMALSELAQRPERSQPIERSRVAPASSPTPRSSEHVASTRVMGAQANPPIDLPLNPADRTVRPTIAGPTLLADPVSPSPWGHRLVVMIGIALVGAAVVLFALASRGSAVKARPPAAQPTAAAAANATSTGLDLLSLRDVREAGELKVTGLVQNPRNGVMLTNVTVTAFAFDEHGALLASGRALLDVTALGPGDESPFVVTVPVTDTVARYRIGFRGEDGRVIAHVDRRQVGTVAEHW